jgi:sodium-dependent dicarboxylate transporter 2/3/5
VIGGAIDAEPAAGSIRPRAVLAVGLAAVAIALWPIPALEPRAHGTLVLLTVAAGLWMTEAVPIAWTALVVPLLAVLLRIADPKIAFSGFGDPILFLFFGTFLLTDAAFEHGLQARLTRAVLHAGPVRRSPSRLLGAVAFLGCGLSAWVNNTATTALVLPVALTAEGRVPRRLFTGVLLMAAYAPSFGGIATPVGTAPNLIGMRLLETGAGAHLSFARWCATFAPLAVVFTAAAVGWFLLVGRRGDVARPATTLPDTTPAARPWSLAERTLVPLFLVVVALWIVPGILQATALRDAAWVQQWSARLPETCVPLVGGLALFLLPSGLPAGGRGARRPRILNIGVLRRIDWSTLLLFGGGLSLGHLMFETGLAKALGDAIFAIMPIEGTFGIVLAACLMAVAVSEITSNTASASLVVPVVLALAQAAGVDPVKPAIAATVACSWGFMLPVSTPPNALVYATGRLRIHEMVRHGILFDIAGAVAIALWVTAVG